VSRLDQFVVRTKDRELTQIPILAFHCQLQLSSFFM
jgi:hypothetical protein